jgi:hypothetical protein
MLDEDISKNLRRGGEYFVLSIWIQSQMADLIILKDHPRIIKRFIERPAKIPKTLRDKRMLFWQKDFGFVKKEFLRRFKNELSEQCIKDIDTIYGIRNAIGHSYVSLARNYFLYRPGSRKKLNEFKKAFDVANPNVDASKPRVFKFDFSNDKIYLHNFAAIQRMDEVHLQSLAKSMGIPHSRIR